MSSSNGANKLGIHRGLSQDDFERIARGGFGDGQNAYAHSMAWFKGHLYVGTTRGNLPLMKVSVPIDLDPWPVECPDDPYDLDLHAQLWRYCPETAQWEQVFRSPTIIGEHGKPIPRSLGYRGMGVFQAEHEDEPALYVATFSPVKGPGCLILRTTDGENFEVCSEPGLVGLPVTSIRALIPFKGKLYTTPTGSKGGKANISYQALVYESSDPASGQWEAVSELGFGDEANIGVFDMNGFGDHLYVTVSNLNGAQIWRSDLEGPKPYRWEKIIDKGAHRGPHNQIFISVYPFKGALYAGSAIQGGGVDKQNGVGPAASELIRIHPDGSWDLLVGEARDTPDGYKEPLSGYRAGFDNFFNGYFWRMCEHDGWLYLGTMSWDGMLGYVNRDTEATPFKEIVSEIGGEFILEKQAGFDLYRSFDGENWMPVTLDGLGNRFNYGVRTLASTPHGLFVGTANPFGPRVRMPGQQELIDNPNGGCEVHLGRPCSENDRAADTVLPATLVID